MRLADVRHLTCTDSFFGTHKVSLYGSATGAGHDRIPVAHRCLASSTSKRSFNAMLCRFFGLPGHDKGNAEELGHTAADAVLACDVRLCVVGKVDDVHFLDPRRRDVLTISSIWPHLPGRVHLPSVGLEWRCPTLADS